MNKGIKYALIFTSGVVVGFGVCGYKVTKIAIGDNDIRETIIHKISNKIIKVIYGEKMTARPNYEAKGSYRDHKKTCQHDDFRFDNVVFETIHDAHNAYKKMEEIVDMYGFVTVADLYETAKLKKPYVFDKYGWLNIRNCEIAKIPSGYIIDLPKPILID